MDLTILMSFLNTADKKHSYTKRIEFSLNCFEI